MAKQLNCRMRSLLLAVILVVLTSPAGASDQPEAARLRATVDTLEHFGTRQTSSTTTDPVRGIGAARTWVADQLKSLSQQCGGCIEVGSIARSFTGPRAPRGVDVVDLLGIQQGADPRRVVIVGAHIDSINSDMLDFAGDAPGANDDGSGVALVLEAARILSKEKFPATIVYAIFSGEEQGLWGSTLLAETAKERGWTVTAMLNNDIVGSTMGKNGIRVTDRVRVFSEGIRQSEDLSQQMARRTNGGEDDGPSRALAKAIAKASRSVPRRLQVFLDRRPDRFGRGGDHEPFLDLGFPAVRFTVGAENWNWQHQTVRTEAGVKFGDLIENMDFGYLAKVTAINVATIRQLAGAPAAPDLVTVEGALSQDTTVHWSAVIRAARYRVYWRRNDQQDWTNHADVSGTQFVARNTPIDDNFFGVSALSADGRESLVTFGGPKPRN